MPDSRLQVLDQCWSDNSELAQKILRQRMDHLHLYAVDATFEDCTSNGVVCAVCLKQRRACRGGSMRRDVATLN